MTGTGTRTQEDKKKRINLFIFAAYVLIIAGVLLGNGLAAQRSGAKPAYDLVDNISLFAFFYVVAQAMERFVEPLSELDIPGFGSDRKRKENERTKSRRKAKSSTTAEDKQANAENADDKQVEADQIKANTKVVIWAVATFCAMLVSGATGLYLLETVGITGLPEWVNILVTGLAVSGGTEPLHKLIKLVENKSDEDDSSDESAPEE